MLLLVPEVRRGQEAVRDQTALRVLAQRDQERGVGELPQIVPEVGNLPVHQELAQDDMPHRHGQRAVGPGVRGQPLVGVLDVVGVVRAHRDDLGAVVARLGQEVRVGRAGHGDVGAPHDQIARVPPVRGLGYVRLVAEDLRRGDRQVGVPVVERQQRAADQRQEAGAGRERGHRHRRDRREAHHAVRTVALDGVHMGGRDQLGDLVPVGAHQAALAPCPLVRAGPGRVTGDLRPGRHGVAQPPPRLAPQLQQLAPHIGVADPAR